MVLTKLPMVLKDDDQWFLNTDHLFFFKVADLLKVDDLWFLKNYDFSFKVPTS